MDSENTNAYVKNISYRSEAVLDQPMGTALSLKESRTKKRKSAFPVRLSTWPNDSYISLMLWRWKIHAVWGVSGQIQLPPCRRLGICAQGGNDWYANLHLLKKDFIADKKLSIKWTSKIDSFWCKRKNQKQKVKSSSHFLITACKLGRSRLLTLALICWYVKVSSKRPVAIIALSSKELRPHSHFLWACPPFIHQKFKMIRRKARIYLSLPLRAEAYVTM